MILYVHIIFILERRTIIEPWFFFFTLKLLIRLHWSCYKNLDKNSCCDWFNELTLWIPNMNDGRDPLHVCLLFYHFFFSVNSLCGWWYRCSFSLMNNLLVLHKAERCYNSVELLFNVFFFLRIALDTESMFILFMIINNVMSQIFFSVATLFTLQW